MIYSPKFTLLAVALSMAIVTLAQAADAPKRTRDLTEATMEDLMNIEVTTVSRKEQKLSQAPAAIFVITQDDIRRSGMTSVPDLLRMVPGIQAAQIQGGAWAISARGFNYQYSNKMLVLVDGRSVYSPNDAGVFWESQDTLLEDIERIEVIRGPGATLWGANAVNGVINIITKSAEETQGSIATAAVGDQGQSLGAFRTGGRIGQNGHYRAFGKYLHGRGLSNPEGRPVIDGVSSISSGFRADWTLSAGDSLTVQGGALRSRSRSEFQTVLLDAPYGSVGLATQQAEDGNLQLNWTHRRSERSNMGVRVSFDRSENSSWIVSEGYSMVDVDFQHEYVLSESNSLVWGLGLRHARSHSTLGFDAGILPASRSNLLASGFVQDQWTLPDKRFTLIVGSKFEHNDYTGVEIQPGARLMWTPNNRHTAWTSISRAVRTPSYVDRGMRITFAGFPAGELPGISRVYGSPSYGSENLMAYEAGYRLQARQRFSVDLAAFYNVYSNLQTFEPGAPFVEVQPQPTHLVFPLYDANLMRGETYGSEIASNIHVTERWRLIPSYNWLRIKVRLDPTSLDPVSLAVAGQNPRHQFQFRSNFDLTRKLQFDSGVYYTAALPALAVAAYTRLDARLGYRPRPDLEISLAAENLQGGRHVEFMAPSILTRATIGRSFVVKLTWGL